VVACRTVCVVVERNPELGKLYLAFLFAREIYAHRKLAFIDWQKEEETPTSLWDSTVLETKFGILCKLV